MNTVVKKIDYEDSIIKIKTDKGEFLTKNVIITVSLGVLKKGSIKFFPQLPEINRKFIDLMGIGVVNKVFLEFDECFWTDFEKGDSFNIISDKNEYSYIFNLKPYTNKNLLMVFI